MSVDMQSADLDALARELAAATGEDVGAAVRKAIEERLQRIPRRLTTAETAEVDALFDRLANMPVLDRRTAEEIIGFGPDGLPL